MKTIFENNLDMYQGDFFVNRSYEPIVDWMVEREDDKNVGFGKTRYYNIRFADGLKGQIICKWFQQGYVRIYWRLTDTPEQTWKPRELNLADDSFGTSLDNWDYIRTFLQDELGYNQLSEMPQDLIDDMLGFIKQNWT